MANAVAFTLITPRAIAFEGDAELVIATGTEGEVGILPSHAPFLTALKPGVLRANVRDGEKTTMRLELACGEGFLQALPDKITILTDAALEADEVDVSGNARRTRGRDRRAEGRRRRSRRLASRAVEDRLRERQTQGRRSQLTTTRVGVSSSLFARHPVLRAELLARYPDATFYEDVARPTEDQMIALLADRDVAIVGLEPITERVLAALPNLKAIGKFGIGCEMIDFDAMVRHGILFGYTQGTNKRASRGTDARLHDRRRCAW